MSFRAIVLNQRQVLLKYAIILCILETTGSDTQVFFQGNYFILSVWEKGLRSVAWSLHILCIIWDLAKVWVW